MFTRFVMLLLVLTSTSSAQVALWFLEGSGTFTNVTRSFEYTEAGGYGVLNLFPGVGESLFVAGDAIGGLLRVSGGKGSRLRDQVRPRLVA